MTLSLGGVVPGLPAPPVGCGGVPPGAGLPPPYPPPGTALDTRLHLELHWHVVLEVDGDGGGVGGTRLRPLRPPGEWRCPGTPLPSGKPPGADTALCLHAVEGVLLQHYLDEVGFH